jgi:hypothetical protein
MLPKNAARRSAPAATVGLTWLQEFTAGGNSGTQQVQRKNNVQQCHPAAYEVKFVDGGGYTIALITVEAKDIRRIEPGELLHARCCAKPEQSDPADRE